MAFESDERFYRVIRNTNPNAWDKECNRPSSAAFKDSQGCSVDRRKLRTESEVLKLEVLFGSFRSVLLFVSNTHNTRRRHKGAVKVNAVVSVCQADCDEKDILTKEDPVINDPELEDNPFHCLLLRDEEKAELTKGQCRHLACKACVTELNSNDFCDKKTQLIR